MNRKNRPVLGIDFGTTNSYFCKYLTQPDGQKIRLIDFGNGQLGGLASTILFRKDKSPIVGKTAEIEWGEATAAERKNYTLRTHFKPDITRSDDAKNDATAFLQTIREQTAARRIDFVSPEHVVIFGLPGESGDDFRDSLHAISDAAGYGKVRLVAEPIGALLYHLWNKDITPSETQKGVLVVDFGGGTCDFAFMQRLEIADAWGDMLLGGRLFDDLFFQWFLDQNPGALAQLIANGDEYFVHWLECRQIKELFSETMTLNRDEMVRGRLGKLRNYGTFNNLSWGEFIDRAKNYRPHDTFVNYLKERNLSTGELLSGKSLDLLAWFQRSLIEGLDKYRIRSSDVERVILTGGSSQWPFVQDIVCEALHIDPKQLLTSENPKAAISEGLVVLPALQHTYERVSQRLQQETPQFFAKRIEPEITRRLDAILNDILNDVTVRLYDGEIAPIIHEYRESGGPLIQLKEKIRATTLNFAPQIEDRIQQKLTDLNAGLPEALHKLIRQWFSENGVSYYGQQVNASEVQRLSAGNADIATTNKIGDLQREIMDVTSVMVIAVTATVMGTITGGTQTALIASGPAGWLVGAVATAATMWMTYEFGRDKINETVEKLDLPSGMVKLILREGKIKTILNEGREKLTELLRKEIAHALEKPLDEMKSQIMRNIDQEVRSLTLINHL